MSERDSYYAGETNGLVDGQAYHATDRSTRVKWTDPRLARITRLRMVSDPGFPWWDITYCHGVLKDGTLCEVLLPFDQLPKKGWAHAIVTHAQADNLYAKGLGIFDAVSTLI